ncbi:Pr6Pr family membrane protein [Actinomadura rubrisoli]|uniref:Pr6Pr family membrane protein n=1 Tax=Actinomadura rubrisoli TaxID=2530368 RepID=UPI001FB5A35F|nr:Pr6Pr family membrane protein [Actinomadura rubrisoli]
MSPARALAAWRAGLALLALASVAAGFLGRRPSEDAVDFLGYFTHLSTLIGAAALLAGAVPGLYGRPRVDWLRGAAALYLAITGAVYALPPGGEVGGWTSWTQHRVLPVAVPLDWLLFATAHRLPARQTLLGWLAFPLGYLAFTLAHGAATAWYPYPFLNAARHGYGVLTTYTTGIAAMFVAVAAFLIGWADLHRERGGPERIRGRLRPGRPRLRRRTRRPSAMLRTRAPGPPRHVPHTPCLYWRIEPPRPRTAPPERAQAPPG